MQHWSRAPLAFLFASAVPAVAFAQDAAPPVAATQAQDLPPALVAPAPMAESVNAAPMLTAINRARAAENLAPLTRDPGLDAVALSHSQEMLSLGYFDHVSPRTGDPGARMRAAGLRAPRLAENIALALSLRVAHENLMASPAHRANLMDPNLTHIGIGVVRGPRGLLVTQLFAAANATPPAATAPVAPAVPAPVAPVAPVQVAPAPAAPVTVAPVPVAPTAPAQAGTTIPLSVGPGVLPIDPSQIPAILQQLTQIPAAVMPYVSPRGPRRPTSTPSIPGGTYWTWDGTRWVPLGTGSPQ